MNRAEFAVFLRYGLVMGLGWLADMLVFALLLRPLGIPGAQLAARIVGAGVGFVLHKYFTFGGVSRTRTGTQLVRTGLIWLFGYFASTALILLLVGAGVVPLVAKFVVEVALVPVNFFLFKSFVFPR
jgi:putative flippase GtrA